MGATIDRPERIAPRDAGGSAVVPLGRNARVARTRQHCGGGGGVFGFERRRVNYAAPSHTPVLRGALRLQHSDSEAFKEPYAVCRRQRRACA